MSARLRLLLPALAYLLAACGTTGGASPTPGLPLGVTQPAAPTAPPTDAALPSAMAVPTPVVLPTSAATPAAAPTAPAAATPAGAAQVLIGYHKSGGIAGIDELFTIDADGTTELRTKGGTVTGHASPSDLQALQTLLSSPEFAALHIPVQPPAADAFVYELTLPGHAKPLVVTDAAENPPALRELINTLEQLKTQAR